MNENQNQSTLQRRIDIGECPLCKGVIYAVLVSAISVPLEKITTSISKINASLEPDSLEVNHFCQKYEDGFAESRPMRRGRPYNRLRPAYEEN